MMDYSTIDEIMNGRGLRIVLVQGLPSPWAQAAKTMFEIKGLDYIAGAWQAGDANEELVAWSGIASAPIVAWNDEKPIDKWLDILNLVERIGPEPALLPADPAQRVQVVGLSNEMCGELGIGWNRRLHIFQPAMESGNPPEGVIGMSEKYRYNAKDLAAAGKRTAATLRLMTRQLETQQERGSRFFVGDRLSAVDIYWTAFMNLIDPLPAEKCPMSEDWRPMFINQDPDIADALDPVLVAHRDCIFDEYFRSPMEF
jgi:glutathione S-transferase